VLGSSGNEIKDNVADGNAAAGISVFDQVPGDSAGNSLRANHTNLNAAHGIDAVEGTLDAGGNTARGNTPAPNCVGVHCIPDGRGPSALHSRATAADPRS
jgi:hypothetical protein